MDKKQKIGIILVIAILIVGLIIIFNKKNDDNKNNNEVQMQQSTNTNDQQQKNTEKEEFVYKTDDGTKLNISTKLGEEREFQGLKIKNIQLTSKDNQTVLLADVTNNSGKDTQPIFINIILLDKNGDEVDKIPGIIAPLKNGASTQLNSSATSDYANAYDFKIEKAK